MRTSSRLRAGTALPIAFVVVALGVVLVVIKAESASPQRASLPEVVAPGCPDALPYLPQWLGTEFAGLPLSSIDRFCEKGDRFSPSEDLLVFSYGECTPDPAAEPASCLDPLEVQIGRLCANHPGLYGEIERVAVRGSELKVETSPEPARQLRVGGLPAAAYENGGAVEIYAKGTTVGIVGKRSLVQSALRELEAVPGSMLGAMRAPQAALTPPPKAALRSPQDCSMR